MTITNPNIAVFISGGGSNLQALIDATEEGILHARIALVVASSAKAYGLERAKNAGIEGLVFTSKNFATPEAAGKYLLDLLKAREIDYIALAGYLKLLPLGVVRSFKGRIVNIHPALLPKHGGKGMYGHYVHEAVLANNEQESGVTVHLVDEVYDHGRILEQVKVPVKPGDTPDDLAASVLVQEHRLYPRVLDKLIKGYYNDKN